MAHGMLRPLSLERSCLSLMNDLPHSRMPLSRGSDELTARRSRSGIGVAFRFLIRTGGGRSTQVKGSFQASGGLPRHVQDRDMPCHRNQPLTRITRWKHAVIVAGGTVWLLVGPGVSLGPSPGVERTPATDHRAGVVEAPAVYQSM